MNRKKYYILILLVSVLILGGWGLKKVEIEGGKLIDLDSILSPNISPSEVEQPSVETEPDKDKDNNEKDNKPAEIVMDKLDIKVRNITITCMGKTYTYNREADDVADFDRVLDMALKSAEIRIEDDYAESHAILCVKRKIYEATGRDASVKSNAIVGREADR